MREKLLELFPEIKQIKDSIIQNKTLATLADAIETGGWTADDLERIPFTLLIKDTRISLVQHTRAITQMAMACARIFAAQYREICPINFDHLIAGALLHDVGKFLEYRRLEGKFGKSKSGKLLRHPFSGAGLCTKHGLPDEIVHIVAVHAREGEGGYRSAEAAIVHHIDFINFEPLREL